MTSDKSFRQNFYRPFKVLLILGSIFGVIPLKGLVENDVSKIKFRWFYWKVFLKLITLFGSFFIAITFLNEIAQVGFNIYVLGSIGFYINACLASILFLNLSKNMPLLLNEWYLLEKRVFLGQKYRSNATRNVHFVIIKFMILALIDNVADSINHIYITLQYNEKNVDFFEYFFTAVAHKSIFLITSYSHWKAILIELCNFTCAFVWTFTDVFIMSISIIISSKLKQMNQRIKQYLRMEVRDLYLWKVVREDYADVCNLTKIVNEKIASVILLSYACNVLAILTQCFNSLREFSHTSEKVYFIYSFFFLLIRTISVCLYAASINQESRKPLKHLFSVKSEIYNVEVKRLIRQLGADDVCLTGRNFFKIKRSLILSIAGSVVTYELIFIQFSGEYLKLNTNM